jgi:hypothetical protein
MDGKNFIRQHGVTVHNYNSSTREIEAGDWEFEASLGCMQELASKKRKVEGGGAFHKGSERTSPRENYSKKEKVVKKQ